MNDTRREDAYNAAKWALSSEELTARVVNRVAENANIVMEEIASARDRVMDETGDVETGELMEMRVIEMRSLADSATRAVKSAREVADLCERALREVMGDDAPSMELIDQLVGNADRLNTAITHIVEVHSTWGQNWSSVYDRVTQNGLCGPVTTGKVEQIFDFLPELTGLVAATQDAMATLWQSVGKLDEIATRA